MIGVAIIGAGNIGRIRANVIKNSRAARVCAVADLDFTRAQELARAADAQAIEEWKDAIRSPDVDVVIVATPTKFHAEAIRASLEAGKHVLCEKPLARSVRETEMFSHLPESSQLILKTGFNYRYMAHVRKAKDIVDSGALGPVYFLRCHYGHGGRPGYEQSWCTDLDLSGGGVLLEQGIHILDLTRYLLGEPSQVLATDSRYFWNFAAVEDNSFLLLRTSVAQTAEIHVSWTQWVNLFSLELLGRDGYLHLTGRDGHYGPQKLVWGKRQANHGRPEEQTFEFSGHNDSWELEWQDFVNAIQVRRQPMGNLSDGIRALELVEAAYKSSREQKWIDVASKKTTVRSAA
ncbi:MAG TPA: Gfo/Idh/MocA family oxidoreductase [Terriglobales bacterium]|jgi:predicted dehydrogenase